MRPIRILCGVVAIICMSVSTGWGYTLNNLGNAGGWDNINKSETVTIVLDASDYTKDLGESEQALGQVDAALRKAYNTWGEVSTAPRLNFLDAGDKGGNYDAFDGPKDSNGPPWFNGTSSTLDQNSDWNYANIVLGGWLPESYFTQFGAGVLAVTWTGKLRGGNGPRKPTWHAEIFFNEGWDWTDNPSSASEIDIETVALHELGHTIGLGHSDDQSAVMWSYYEGVRRIPGDDDIAGVTALYGEGNGKGKGKPPWAGGPKKVTFDGTDWYLTGVTYVPEPSSLLLAAFGLLGLLGYGWRKRRAV